MTMESTITISPTASSSTSLSGLFERFADLLSYPTPELPAAVRDCRQLLRSTGPSREDRLITFEHYVSTTAPTAIEEAYTHAFDLDALCHLYVGYHIFGESYKRSLFLLELRKRYRQCGLKIERELPDHLAAILRFLARSSDATAEAEMIDEAILPSLGRMLGNSTGAKSADPKPADAPDGDPPPPEGESDAGLPQDHPYRVVLETLYQILEDQRAARPNEASGTSGAGGAERA